MRVYTKWFARLGLLLGATALLTCFYPKYLFYGMLCSVLGTLLSVGVIFTRSKYAIPTKWNHISFFSIVLCSAPVIYVLVILFVLKK